MSVIGNVLARQFIYDLIFKGAPAGRCKKKRRIVSAETSARVFDLFFWYS